MTTEDTREDAPPITPFKGTPDQYAVYLELRKRGVARDKATERATEVGVTLEDIEWNARFGRPPEWKETVQPEEEEARRAAWAYEHEDLA